MFSLLNNMPAQEMNGYFATAIGGMAVAIAFLSKWILSELSDLKRKVPALEEKLDKEIQERHQSDLKALRADIESKMPCHLPECPKRATYSVVADHCPLGGG